MKPLIIGSLFSGIGGLELGLERSGLGQVAWQVEKAAFPRTILAKHWPSVERFEDVSTVGIHNLREVDIICGGFPCQDISSAGKGAGLAGNRSGLWFEYARIIKELGPTWVVVENVASGARHWVDQVTESLEQLGYETIPIPLSAKDVGAPHFRRRIFIIAYSEREQLREQQRRRGGPSREGQAQSIDTGAPGLVADITDDRLPERSTFGHGEEHPTIKDFSEVRITTDPDNEGKPTVSIDGEVASVQKPTGPCLWNGGQTVSPVLGVDDGVPNRVDRIRALGNAVVPQCAEVIGHIIQELRREYE